MFTATLHSLNTRSTCAQCSRWSNRFFTFQTEPVKINEGEHTLVHTHCCMSVAVSCFSTQTTCWLWVTIQQHFKIVCQQISSQWDLAVIWISQKRCSETVSVIVILVTCNWRIVWHLATVIIILICLQLSYSSAPTAEKWISATAAPRHTACGQLSSSRGQQRSSETQPGDPEPPKAEAEVAGEFSVWKGDKGLLVLDQAWAIRSSRGFLLRHLLLVVLCSFHVPLSALDCELMNH